MKIFHRFPAMAWLLPILLLAGIIGTELGWGTSVKASLPQPKLQKYRPAVVPLQPDFDLLSLDQAYTQILSRPLFVSGRRSLMPSAASARNGSASSSSRRRVSPPPPSPPSRPTAPVVEEPPKEKMRKGQFVLDGIIIARDKNIALLREVSTRKTVRAELGEEINGMLVEQVEPDRITFKQGEERELLILKVKTGPKPARQSIPARQGGPGGGAVPVSSPVAPAEPANTVPGAAPAAAIPAPSVADGDPATPSFVERRRALRQRPPQ